MRAVSFKSPERVPISHEDTHFVCVCSYDAELLNAKKENLSFWTDEWGIKYNRPTEENDGTSNKGLPVGEPLVEYEKIDDYPFWPSWNSAYFQARLKDLDNAVEKNAMEERYLIAGWFCHAEKLWQLEGMEKAFLDLSLDPERVNAIMDRVERFTMDFLNIAEHRHAGKIDALYIGDDWGTQTSALIGMEHFREFFKERYRRIIARAHNLGMLVWMHSCGYINEILEELVDCGLDVINPCQPLTLGIDEISRRYRGRIAFEVPADIQWMLPLTSGKTRAEIEAHVRELIEKWGTQSGGIIGFDYGDYPAIGTTAERANWAMDVFKKHKYRG
jgi:hypothetical protein